MKWSEVATVDFESLPINFDGRPDYPPTPVGVSIKLGHKKSKYYGFGHPTGRNNCTYSDARSALGDVWESGRPILFHHEKFDVAIAEEEMGMERLPWDRYHDTMHMLYLHNPRARTYSLKPTAEDLLGEKPEERDALIDWLVENQPIPDRKLKPTGKKTYAGAYVAWCPGDIAGVYACGDTDRTFDIARLVYSDMVKRGMQRAYDVERRLFPHLLNMEQQGIRVDLKRLTRDVEKYSKVMKKLDRWLYKKLKIKADEEINPNTGNSVLDSSALLAKYLVRSKCAKEEDFGVTKTGKMQTNKDALTNAIKDKQLLNVLKYRTQLNTCLNMFMKNWLRTAVRSGGFIYTQWHATRDGDYGTKTGRLSSTPNFQNISKEFTKLFNGKGLPRSPFPLPPLPLVRDYIIAYDDDHILIDRDYSQQELRILAHFEGGQLMDSYLADPWLDLHDHARELINNMLRKNFPRKHIKNQAFGLLYGMGVGKMAEKNGTTVEEAKLVKEAYLDIFPGLKKMYAIMKQRAKDNEPIYTWAGREYYCEEPRYIDGKYRTFDYRLFNLLIQGSAADCTKLATAQYCEAKPDHHRLHLITHDQLVASVPKDEVHKGMKIMRESMESVKFDVPMLTEGSTGPTHEKQKDYDKKGQRL